jgi:Protein of unknown function (DUF3618)
VAASRDPEAIAREIEQTRAELAAAVDAIAYRVNPKRAANRVAQALNRPEGRVAAGVGVVLVLVVLLRRRRAR